MSQNEILDLMQELVEGQKRKMRNCALEIIPHLTDEDLLQPNDYPRLENNPLFRYEEGVLEGMKTAQTALFSLFSETDFSHPKTQ